MGRNDQAVTAQVDVLAVLRRVSRHVPNEDFVEFDDALHAVAELVEASRAFANDDRQRAWHSMYRPMMVRLHAALARVGGSR